MKTLILSMTIMVSSLPLLAQSPFKTEDTLSIKIPDTMFDVEWYVEFKRGFDMIADRYLLEEVTISEGIAEYIVTGDSVTLETVAEQIVGHDNLLQAYQEHLRSAVIFFSHQIPDMNSVECVCFQPPYAFKVCYSNRIRHTYLTKH